MCHLMDPNDRVILLFHCIDTIKPNSSRCFIYFNFYCVAVRRLYNARNSLSDRKSFLFYIIPITTLRFSECLNPIFYNIASRYKIDVAYLMYYYYYSHYYYIYFNQDIPSLLVWYFCIRDQKSGKRSKVKFYPSFNLNFWNVNFQWIYPSLLCYEVDSTGRPNLPFLPVLHIWLLLHQFEINTIIEFYLMQCIPRFIYPSFSFPPNFFL